MCCFFVYLCMSLLYVELHRLGLIDTYNYVMENNPGKNNPYHNNLHLERVCDYALRGCNYYSYSLSGLSKALTIDYECMKIVAIAALFHDFGHTGNSVDDSININIAIKAFEDYILSDGKEYQSYKNDVISLISVTQYPYIIPHDDISFVGRILRDSDIIQGLFCETYLRDIVNGLAMEKNVSFKDMLNSQIGFYENFDACTNWGNTLFEKGVSILRDDIEYLIENI